MRCAGTLWEETSLASLGRTSKAGSLPGWGGRGCTSLVLWVQGSVRRWSELGTCPLPPLEGDPHSHPPCHRYKPHPLHFLSQVGLSFAWPVLSCVGPCAHVHAHTVFAHPLTTLYPTSFKYFSLTSPPLPHSQAHMPTHPHAFTVFTNVLHPSYLLPGTDTD